MLPASPSRYLDHGQYTAGLQGHVFGELRLPKDYGQHGGHLENVRAVGIASRGVSSPKTNRSVSAVGSPMLRVVDELSLHKCPLFEAIPVVISPFISFDYRRRRSARRVVSGLNMELQSTLRHRNYSV